MYFKKHSQISAYFFCLISSIIVPNENTFFQAEYCFLESFFFTLKSR